MSPLARQQQALQQHVFWGALLAGLAIYGSGSWSLDRFTAPRLLKHPSSTKF